MLPVMPHTIPRVVEPQETDARARTICQDAAAGRCDSEAAYSQLGELVDRDVIESAVRRQYTHLQPSDIDDITSEVAGLVLGLLESQRFDLSMGCRSSFTGWVRQISYPLSCQAARRHFKGSAPVAYSRSSDLVDRPAVDSDERIMEMVDDVELRASRWQRGAQYLRCQALSTHLDLPRIARPTPVQRRRLLAEVDDRFGELGLASMRFAAGSQGTDDPLVRDLSDLWRFWHPETIDWFLTYEPLASSRAEAVELLTETALKPLPRPAENKIRNASMRIRQLPGRKIPGFASAVVGLVRSWVDVECEDAADADLHRMRQQMLRSYATYMAQLDQAARLAGEPQSVVQGWIAEALGSEAMEHAVEEAAA